MTEPKTESQTFALGQTLEGAVFGQANQGFGALGELVTKRRDGSNSAQRNAAAAFYDLAINPAESAIGAGVLRGAAGSALILGHGVRNRNGLLLADRAGFVDAAAGPKEEPIDAD